MTHFFKNTRSLFKVSITLNGSSKGHIGSVVVGPCFMLHEPRN